MNPGSPGALERLEAELERRPRTWLVTGAAGFIGSHLVRRLLALGQRVRGLDDLSTGRESNLAAVEQQLPRADWRRFELLRGDLCDPLALERALEGVELVLHQAALGSVPRSLADPARTLAVNAQGSWRLFLAAQRAGVERVVYASSSSVYGGDPPGDPGGDRGARPQGEDQLGPLLSPYAASKRIAELAAQGLAPSGGPILIGLRYFNVFGPRQDPAGPYAAVIPRWIAALLRGEAPRVFGDGTTARDFTPVASVVAANLLACRPGRERSGRVYNVGSGRTRTLLELLERLQSLAGTPSGAPAVFAPARPFERRSSQADPARAREELGLEPVGEEDWSRALRETVEAQREHSVDSRRAPS